MLKLLTVTAACLLVAAVAEDVDCPPGTKTNRATLGGKEVSAEFKQLKIGTKCVWVTLDSKAEVYRTETCTKCWAPKPTERRCVGSGLAYTPPPCEMVLGPDCKFYEVDQSDHTKACEPPKLLLPPPPPPPQPRQAPSP